MSALSGYLREVAVFLAPGVTVVASTLSIRAEAGQVTGSWSEILVAAAAAIVTSAAVSARCRHETAHAAQDEPAEDSEDQDTLVR